MAYIHNKPDIKVDNCDPQKVKEMLMKYGYGCPGHKYMCEDIDEQSTKKKPYPILEEVEKILSGARRKDYGTPKESFKRIADYWNAYLCHKRDLIDKSAHEEDLPYEFLRGAYLDTHDVAMMMVLFKIAREENGHTHDSCVDIIGYTALADEMEE